MRRRLELVADLSLGTGQRPNGLLSRPRRQEPESDFIAGRTPERHAVGRRSARKEPDLMPYFLCPACALQAYSAAAESRCPRCDTRLESNNQLHPSIPLAEPVSGRRSRPEATGWRRFRRAASDGLPEVGRQ